MKHLIVHPTESTMRRLQDIMSGAPMQMVPFNELFIPILETKENDVADYVPTSKTVYTLEFKGFKGAYDVRVGHTKLVGFGYSPGLMARRQKLTGELSDWLPHITFSYAYEMARTSKHWVASVSDTLVSKESAFTFQGEEWVDAQEPYTSPVFTPKTAEVYI